MTRSLGTRWAIAPSDIRRNLVVGAAGLAFLLSLAGFLWSAEEGPPDGSQDDSAGKVCRVLADRRLEKPLGTIVDDYRRRTNCRITLEFLSAAEVNALVKKGKTEHDMVVCLSADVDRKPAVGLLEGAKAVAWKHPSGLPVWAAALTKRPEVTALFRFLGGPTGHRLWAESEAGFRIASGKTRAEAYEWVVEHRTKHTYPMTAMRMLRECGGIRDGVCIDVGCGSGYLDIELAKRSNFRIIGLDIDPDVKPMFEKKIREAGLEKRITF
ncbi:MAG: class I SAM-dependent methyltransferase, partial [Planctomycetota bacterium]